MPSIPLNQLEMKAANRIRSSFYTLFSFSLLLCACSNTNTTQTDGWYAMEDGAVKGQPILTLQDMQSVQLDSASFNQSDTLIYMIMGRFNPSGTRKFADYTEKNIGKMIGFQCDGEVICSPVINMKIDQGNFQITLPPTPYNREKTHHIYQKIKSQL